MSRCNAWRSFLQINALVALKLFRHPVDHPLVEIVAAQVRIAGSGADFEDSVADIEDRNIEGAAAEVEHQDRFVLLLVEAVGERCRRRLVDDAEHVQSGDLAGVLGRLPLRVVEVGRDGDHRVVDLLAQILGRVVGELAQYQRGNLFRRVLLAHDLKAHGVVRAGTTL